MTIAPVILWFRDDLRLSDHAALHEALETGRPIVPVFVLDENSPWPLGRAARWWLHHGLAALSADLAAKGSFLVLRRGAAAKTIPGLVAETGAVTVFAGGSATPRAREDDRAIAARLKPGGVEFHRMRTGTLFNPDRIKTRTGGAFSVFTPFARACFALGPPRDPIPPPSHLPAPPPVPSDRLDDWRLLPGEPGRDAGLRVHWAPGEAGARSQLNRFLDGSVADYATARDVPGLAGTSMLSPHLRFGEISPSQVWHEVRARPVGAAAEKFLGELLWREFSHYQLWHRPDLPEAPSRPRFAAMRWRDDPVALQAWQQGRTGIPIVDAGMRQLRHTGWMHNRVRMIVASFLVKHLLIDWRLGQAWFWDMLVDADLGNNAANWQWVAGSGADAAPYFRVFNPVLQGRKFDPDGVYTRQFVPELRGVATRDLHAPWEAPLAVRPAGYPAPVVDLALGRARALAAFGALGDVDD